VKRIAKFILSTGFCALLGAGVATPEASAPWRKFRRDDDFERLERMPPLDQNEASWQSSEIVDRHRFLAGLEGDQ